VPKAIVTFLISPAAGYLYSYLLDLAILGVHAMDSIELLWAYICVFCIQTGRLTDEEYDVIKKHPGTGSGILGEIKTRPDLVIGARWHHERYDAMTSNRSYRNYLPQEKVRSELEAGFGTQFDEKVARAMISIMDEDKDYVLHE